jgi:hypothetical protein
MLKYNICNIRHEQTYALSEQDSVTGVTGLRNGKCKV